VCLVAPDRARDDLDCFCHLDDSTVLTYRVPILLILFITIMTIPHMIRTAKKNFLTPLPFVFMVVCQAPDRARDDLDCFCHLDDSTVLTYRVLRSSPRPRPKRHGSVLEEYADTQASHLHGGFGCTPGDWCDMHKQQTFTHTHTLSLRSTLTRRQDFR
jgi:hypothetical protein